MKNDLKNKTEKKWIFLIFFTISILFSMFFSIPANAATGDLILDTRILFPYWDFQETTPLAATLLKEGYSLSMDDVNSYLAADFTIYKNKEIVKRMKVNAGDYFYYNTTIDGIEYTIVESKVDGIFEGPSHNSVILKPFYQYSDGSAFIEPDFVSTHLNPGTTDTPPEEWNRRFGGKYDDNVWSVQKTKDGGYLLGVTIESRKFENIPSLIKVDANGNEQWNKTVREFGDISSVLRYHNIDYIFMAIKSFEMPAQQTSDGGFILAGNSRLVKTNSNGIEQWSKTIGVYGFYTYSVRQTPDGGYIQTGLGQLNDDSRLNDAYLLKTDSNGTKQWSRTFGGADNDHANSVQNTLDGGYILAGMALSYGTGGDAWLIKTDAHGNEQWNKTFGSEGYDSVNSVVQASDGGYVLAGTIDTASNPDLKGQILYEDYDAWLFKTDPSGNLEWSKTFGGLKRDEARFVQETKDGGYVIAGTTESYGSEGSDIWLIKVSREPEGTENIPAAIQTETGNTRWNITGISNKTETLAASSTQTTTTVPP